MSSKEERDRIRAEIDFGDLGPDFVSRRPERHIGHASAELEAALRSVIRQPGAEVDSYPFHKWAGPSFRRALRSVLTGDDVLVATSESDPSLILRSVHEDAAPLCSAMQTSRFWGEKMEFRELVSEAVPAWGAERPGFSYVVVASAGRYVLLLEDDRASVESVLSDRLRALADLADGEATG